MSAPDMWTYRGWSISADCPPIPCRDFDWTATHPSYDVDCDQDGFFDNGMKVNAATYKELLAEIDLFELDLAEERNMSVIDTIQQALEALAAEHGASHVRLSHSKHGNGRVFYTAGFHNGHFVRSAHADTLQGAITKALAATPFDATPDAEREDAA